MRRNFLVFFAACMIIAMIGISRSPKVDRVAVGDSSSFPGEVSVAENSDAGGESDQAETADDELIATDSSELPQLLLAMSDVQKNNDASKPWIVRRRYVELNREVLNGDVFAFSPFAGHDYRVVPERVEKRTEDSFSLYSHIIDDAGQDLGKAFIAVVAQEGEVGFAGTFFLKDGRAFNLIHDESGKTIVEEVLPGQLPIDVSDGKAVPVDASEIAGVDGPAAELEEEQHITHAADGEMVGVLQGSSSQIVSATAAVNSTMGITFLALYSPQARSGAGGTAAIKARIQLSVDVTNQAYEDSEVAITLQLVHMQETTAESGNFDTDLNRITSTTDNYMDEAHTLRQQYGADLVGLIVQGMQYCGLAWLGKPNSGYAAYGFSVTNQYCAPMHVLAHELGHNMGAHHDRANASGGGAYSYSYGQHLNNKAYRTIMAYAPGTRIGYFSNPNISYNGHPTGVANMQDNARTLNNMATIVASYRGDTFTISGQVSYGEDLPLSGAVISAGLLGSAVSDTNGHYSIRNLAGGSKYTLSISRGGFGFATGSVSATLNNNVSHDFVGNYLPQLGAISDRNLARLPGTITLPFAAADTDSEDELSFTVSTHPYSAPYHFKEKLGLYTFKIVNSGVIFTGSNSKKYLLRTTNTLHACSVSDCSKYSATSLVSLFSAYRTNPAALINLAAPSGVIAASAAISGSEITIARNGYSAPFLVRLIADDGVSEVDTAFKVTVLNTAPVISSISSSKISGASAAVSVVATDADSDSLTYDATFIKNAEALAYQLSKNYQLTGHYKDYKMKNYVFYTSSLGTTYAIDYKGNFYEVIKGGKLAARGNVGASYYKAPAKLIKKAKTYDYLVTFSISGDTITFAPNGFKGTFPIAIKVSDGTIETTKNYTITVN